METFNISEIDRQESNNRARQCISEFHGHTEILKLPVTKHDIDLSSNSQAAYSTGPKPFYTGSKFLYDEIPMGDETNVTSGRNNAYKKEIEWFDTYQHAYRIAYENRSHLKQTETESNQIELRI